MTLPCAGFKRTYFQAVPPEDSHTGRGGMEFMAVWHKG